MEETLVWLKDIGVRTVHSQIRSAPPRPRSRARIDRREELRRRSRNRRASCTAGRTAPRKKFSRRTKQAAADSDGALTGLGGCPFAGDELVGNIPTEAVLTTLAARGSSTGIDTKSLAIACAMTGELLANDTRTYPKRPKPPSLTNAEPLKPTSYQHTELEPQGRCPPRSR